MQRNLDYQRELAESLIVSLCGANPNAAEEVVVTVHIEGTLDVKRAPRLRRQLRENLDCSRNMRIDLSDVSFIDGSGLAGLVEVFHAARRQGKACSLVGASDAVMQVLELNRLDRVFAFSEQKERHRS